jgi:hypothetical protein
MNRRASDWTAAAVKRCMNRRASDWTAAAVKRCTSGRHVTDKQRPGDGGSKPGVELMWFCGRVYVQAAAEEERQRTTELRQSRVHKARHGPRAPKSHRSLHTPPLGSTPRSTRSASAHVFMR